MITVEESRTVVVPERYTPPPPSLSFTVAGTPLPSVQGELRQPPPPPLAVAPATPSTAAMI